MGKIRRKFQVEFKQQLVQQIELGAITQSQAAREYQISASVIGRWRLQFQRGVLVERPSTRERLLEAENEKLKAKVGDLTMKIDLLKKMEDYARRQRSADSSVITGFPRSALRPEQKSCRLYAGCPVAIRHAHATMIPATRPVAGSDIVW